MSIGGSEDLHINGGWEAMAALQQVKRTQEAVSATPDDGSSHGGLFAQCLAAATSGGCLTTAVQQAKLMDPLEFMPTDAEIEFMIEQPAESTAFSAGRLNRPTDTSSHAEDVTRSVAAAVGDSDTVVAEVRHRQAAPDRGEDEDIALADNHGMRANIGAEWGRIYDSTDAVQAVIAGEKAMPEGGAPQIEEGTAVAGVAARLRPDDDQRVSATERLTVGSRTANAVDEDAQGRARVSQVFAHAGRAEDNLSAGDRAISWQRSMSGHASYSQVGSEAEEFQSTSSSFVVVTRQLGDEKVMKQDTRGAVTAFFEAVPQQSAPWNIGNGNNATDHHARFFRFEKQADETAGNAGSSSVRELSFDHAVELGANSPSGLPAPLAERASIAEIVQLGRLDARHVVSWLVRKAQVVVQDGRLEVELQLEPKWLGKMKVSMEIVADVLTAHIEVCTPAAKDAIERQLPVLQQRLQERGLRAEKIEIALAPPLLRPEAQPAESRSLWPHTATEQHRHWPPPRQQRGRSHRFGQNSFLDFMA